MPTTLKNYGSVMPVLGGAGIVHESTYAAVTQDVTWNMSMARNTTNNPIRVSGFGQYIPTSGPVTIEFRVSIGAATNNSVFAFGPLPLVANRLQMHWLLNNGSTYFDFGDINGDVGRLQVANSNAWVGNWVHVACIVDPTSTDYKMQILVNGVRVSAIKNTSSTWTGGVVDLLIGDGQAKFAGLIGEFRVWNIARTAAAINADKNISIGAARPGLLGCWRMDETGGAGTTITDRSGNNRHGVVY